MPNLKQRMVQGATFLRLQWQFAATQLFPVPVAPQSATIRDRARHTSLEKKPHSKSRRSRPANISEVIAWSLWGLLGEASDDGSIPNSFRIAGWRVGALSQPLGWS